MVYIIRYYFIFLFIFVSSFCSAQNISKDSVAKLISHFNKSNTTGIGKVRELNVLANAFIKVNLDSALIFANSALELAKSLNDIKGEADALLNLTYYYENKPDYIKGLQFALLGTSKYESIDDGKGLAETYIEIAMLYKKMGGDKITEEYIETGLNYSKKAYENAQKVKDTFLMACALNQSGIIYRDWGKKDGKSFYYDSAFNCYTRAISLTSNGAAEEVRGRLYNNISQVYTEHEKNYTKALEYLFKAIDFNKQHSRITSLSYNYGNVSEVYLKLNNRKMALEYAYKTFDIAQQMKLPSRLQNAYSQLYKVYESIGRYDSALHCFRMMTSIGDSLLNIEKAGQIADTQTKYETVKKEATISVLDTSNKIKTKNIYLLLTGLLLTVVFAIAMILLYNRVQKQKIQLAEQSNKLELMMKELHHRVKNNLQIVSSLLSLQSYRLQDTEAIAAMNESKQRVQAMSLIHQRLYKSDMLTSVNIKEYITDLTASLMAAYGYQADDFELQLNIEKELMDVEKALPTGLILNEVITNAFKYAYKDIAAPSLHISLQEKDCLVQLVVKDNGIGINAESWNKKTGSFGKQLISSLCKQLRAQQQVSGDRGTAFTFIIPVKAA